jgi:hypothetical protein
MPVGTPGHSGPGPLTRPKPGTMRAKQEGSESHIALGRRPLSSETRRRRPGKRTAAGAGGFVRSRVRTLQGPKREGGHSGCAILGWCSPPEASGTSGAAFPPGAATRRILSDLKFGSEYQPERESALQGRGNRDCAQTNPPGASAGLLGICQTTGVNLKLGLDRGQSDAPVRRLTCRVFSLLDDVHRRWTVASKRRSVNELSGYDSDSESESSSTPATALRDGIVVGPRGSSGSKHLRHYDGRFSW